MGMDSRWEVMTIKKPLKHNVASIHFHHSSLRRISHPIAADIYIQVNVASAALNQQWSYTFGHI